MLNLLIVTKCVNLDKEGAYLINKVKRLASNSNSVIVISQGGNGIKEIMDSGVLHHQKMEAPI